MVDVDAKSFAIGVGEFAFEVRMVLVCVVDWKRVDAWKRADARKIEDQKWKLYVLHNQCESEET